MHTSYLSIVSPNADQKNSKCRQFLRSDSSSDDFPHTFREPRKQRRLDFNNSKQTLILTSLRLLTSVDYVSLITDLIVGSKTCGILYPYFRKWRKPMA